jgi:hypothetical protein
LNLLYRYDYALPSNLTDEDSLHAVEGSSANAHTLSATNEAVTAELSFQVFLPCVPNSLALSCACEMWLLQLPSTTDLRLCILRILMVNANVPALSPLKKSWHAGHISFPSIAAPHRAHAFPFREASAPLAFFRIIFTA